jgi:hypothetical protein
MIFPYGLRGEFDFIKGFNFSTRWPSLDIGLLKRRLQLWKQKLTRGFSDDELWSLDITVAKFMLPRLKRLIKIDPFSRPEAIEAFKEIAWMLEKTIECDFLAEDCDRIRFEKATLLLAKNLHRMWY